MNKSYTLYPAYGAQYRSKATAKQAFDDGKDFIDASWGAPESTYISIRDISAGSEVVIKYGHPNTRSVRFFTK
jgi:hypothetical protein